MADMRICRRIACRWPAAASLSFRYDTGQVWILDLAVTAHPTLWDLCIHHADGLTVPRGWERVDLRTPSAPPVEHAGHDRMVMQPSDTAAGPGARTPAAVRHRNRYAALSAELPRLAAAVDARRTSSDSARPDRRQPGVGTARPAPTRELAPMPAPARGQLVMPIDTGRAN